jgi:ribonuclease E
VATFDDGAAPAPAVALAEPVTAVEAAPAVLVAAAAEPVAAPVAAVVAVAPAPAPAVAAIAAPAAPAPTRAEPYTLPTEALQTIAQTAGLEWVNSDAEKIRAVQAAMAAEPQAIRVPREPKRHVLADDGPLVLVETRKDLSQIKLPFEQGASS